MANAKPALVDDPVVILSVRSRCVVVGSDVDWRPRQQASDVGPTPAGSALISPTFAHTSKLAMSLGAHASRISIDPANVRRFLKCPLTYGLAYWGLPKIPKPRLPKPGQCQLEPSASTLNAVKQCEVAIPDMPRHSTTCPLHLPAHANARSTGPSILP